MIRKSESFGIALLAMVALSALGAHGASATPLTVEVPQGGSAFYTGDQDGGTHDLTTPSGTVKCTTVTFIGKSTVGPSVNDLTFEPSYTGCTAYGNTADVKVNGCTYTFTTPTNLGDAVTWGSSAGGVTFHLVCSFGKPIEITPTKMGVSVCTQFIPEQTPTEGHILGTNKDTGFKKDFTLDFALKGLHYTGTGGVCGNGETHSDAQYNGNSTVRVYSNAQHTIQVNSAFELPPPSGVAVTGDQDGGSLEFKTPSGSVKCTTLAFTGWFYSSVDELTLSPSYAGCNVYGFVSAHVKPNGCTYTLTTPTTVSETENTWSKEQIHIVCPAGKQIEFTPTGFGVSACTQFIPSQTPTEGHILGTNKGTESTMDVTLNFALKGIHYTGTGGVCGNSETHSDGQLIGSSTLSPYTNETHTTASNITVEGKTSVPLTVNEGDSGKSFFTGDQDGGVQKLSSPEGSVECGTATFTATSEGATVSELTVKPIYTGCAAFGFATTHVITNECTYTITTPSTTISTDEVTWHPGDFHIACPAGKRLEITPTSLGASVCTQSIGSQTPTGGHVLGTNTGLNNPNGMDITLDLALKGIHYTGTGGVCGTSGTNAEYSGNSTFRAYSNEVHSIQRGVTFD